MIVLGVDPGTSVTGYAFLENGGGPVRVLEYGVIRCRAADPLEARLGKIHRELKSLMEAYRPTVLALENIFFARHPRSALVLGHARGAIMVAAQAMGLQIAEYAPRMVKQSAVGWGGASKEQVSRMIRLHLNLKQAPEPSDAADALAVAYCHLLQSKPNDRIPAR